MKPTKITFSLLFLIGFNCLKAQTALYTLDCEKFASGSVASTINNITPEIIKNFKEYCHHHPPRLLPMGDFYAFLPSSSFMNNC
jgi:hypothetical protein